MKFKVLIGFHADENGKSYGEGEIVETDRDLVAQFGANKFELVSGTPAQVENDDDDDSTGGDERPGEDVTEKFPEATEKAVEVYKDGKNYFVYDIESGDILNDEEDLTSQKKVTAFIDELELEDEE